MTEKKRNVNNLKSLFNGEVLKNVFADRARTNLLKKQEQIAISWLVQRIPAFISSNMLTGIGFFGNIIVTASFILAAYFSRSFLL
ncbi:MAG: CDP-alcohol phosphatidyltransferase, partial [Bacteroidales bacterium]|nr:CDP-alcohol phosphatidyltransferase [Bacteroidales bacterium]